MTVFAQLPRERSSIILPLVPPSSEAGHMTFVHAMLEGRQRGQVWVDDAGQPRSAVVMSDADFCVAIGEARGDLVAASLPAMMAECRAEKPQLLASTPAWEAALNPLSAVKRPRNEYHFRGLPEAMASLRPPGGYKLVPLDADIARKFEGRVDPWVVRIWGGPGRFVEEAFGWAVMRGDELASFCTACAIGGREAEIEIGTADDSRKLGLATVAGAAFIRSCFERRLDPAWTCEVGNTGSERLAEKLGFEFFRTIGGYALPR